MKVISPSYEILPYSEVIGYAQRIEQAGRVCYKSEGKITPDSAVPFVHSLIKRGHESVLEHARLSMIVSDETAKIFHDSLKRKMILLGNPCYIYFHIKSPYEVVVSGNVRAWRDTMKMYREHLMIPEPLKIIACRNKELFPEHDYDFSNTNKHNANPEKYRGTDFYRHIRDISIRFICDRAIANELVRHRAASFSQESTRYCNYGNGKFGGELTVIEPCFFDRGDDSFVYWYNGCYQAEKHYFHLLENGASPQEARDVLPLSLKTELIMTATLSQWKEIFTLRTAPAAHPQMRELMLPLQAEFQERWPDIF